MPTKSGVMKEHVILPLIIVFAFSYSILQIRLQGSGNASLQFELESKSTKFLNFSSKCKEVHTIKNYGACLRRIRRWELFLRSKDYRNLTINASHFADSSVLRYRDSFNATNVSKDVVLIGSSPNYYHNGIQALSLVSLLQCTRSTDFIIEMQSKAFGKMLPHIASSYGIPLKSVSDIPHEVTCFRSVSFRSKHSFSLAETNSLSHLYSFMTKQQPKWTTLLTRPRHRGGWWNEDEAVFHLKTNLIDVRTVRFDKKNEHEQARIAQASRIFISPHGAGLFNLVFLPFNSCVIEIFPDHHSYRAYKRLASTRPDLRYIPLIGAVRSIEVNASQTNPYRDVNHLWCRFNQHCHRFYSRSGLLDPARVLDAVRRCTNTTRRPNSAVTGSTAIKNASIEFKWEGRMTIKSSSLSTNTTINFKYGPWPRTHRIRLSTKEKIFSSVPGNHLKKLYLFTSDFKWSLKNIFHTSVLIRNWVQFLDPLANTRPLCTISNPFPSMWKSLPAKMLRLFCEVVEHTAKNTTFSVENLEMPLITRTEKAQGALMLGHLFLTPKPPCSSNTYPEYDVFIIQRQNSRQLVNCGEAVEFLRMHSLTVRFGDLATMDLCTQIKTLMSARIIVGVHGAGLFGLTHLFFPNKPIIVISHTPCVCDRKDYSHCVPGRHSNVKVLPSDPSISGGYNLSRTYNECKSESRRLRSFVSITTSPESGLFLSKENGAGRALVNLKSLLQTVQGFIARLDGET